MFFKKTSYLSDKRLGARRDMRDIPSTLEAEKERRLQIYNCLEEKEASHESVFGITQNHFIH
jgi:hypothetical protein